MYDEYNSTGPRTKQSVLSTQHWGMSGMPVGARARNWPLAHPACASPPAPAPSLLHLPFSPVLSSSLHRQPLFSALPSLIMDEIAPEYDVVVLGTGALVPRRAGRRSADATAQVSRNACCLGRPLLGPMTSGAVLIDWHGSVLSVKGQKVLHIDRNDHYGG